MAHMIPKELFLEDYDEKSREDRVWKALSNLSDDYYVFHSVHQVNTIDDHLKSREIDFLVVHPVKGILVLECKAGTTYKYEERRWWSWDHNKRDYKVMKRGGPYKQAESALYEYRNAMENHRNEMVQELRWKLNFFHSVWFVDYDRRDLERYDLPEEANLDLTLFRTDLLDPTKKIEKIFKLFDPMNYLTKDEFDLLLNGFLSPHLNLVPTPKTRRGEADYEMAQLLYEQFRILDFLEEQQCAVINGAAGTGKTMVALEKARRHSMKNERVLFLCYNRLLRNKLENEYKKADDPAFAAQYKNIDFFTISKLTKEKTGSVDDYEGFNKWVGKNSHNDKAFPYKHIIIDEGQDFAMVDEEEGISRSDAEKNCTLITALQDAIVEKGGTFYIFYDENQTIQGKDDVEYILPDCIKNASCKLTLTTNCRNTMEIAATSMKPLKDSRGRQLRPKTLAKWEQQPKPTLHLVDSEEKMVKSLNSLLASCEKQQFDDIVILTTGSVANSCLWGKTETGTGEDDGYEIYTYQGLRYHMTTCRKFKGLEADAIILIDLNKKSFTGKRGMNFYVGSSRAKYRLDMVAEAAPEDYYEMAASLSTTKVPKLPVPQKMANILGEKLAADVVIE